MAKKKNFHITNRKANKKDGKENIYISNNLQFNFDNGNTNNFYNFNTN